MTAQENEAGVTGSFVGPCVMELLGHRVLYGHVSESELAGAKFLRVDIPEHTDYQGHTVPSVTHYVAPGSLYCLTPCTEEALSQHFAPPVRRYLGAPRREDDDGDEYTEEGEEPRSEETLF